MRREDDEAPRDESSGGRERPPGTGSGITPRQVLIAIAVILLVAFAAANFRTVSVSFLLFTTKARVVTVIVVAGILGFLAGYFVGRPSREERKRLRERDDRRD